MSKHCGYLDSSSREEILPNFRLFLKSCIEELFEVWNQNVIERSKKLLKTNGTK
jgi:hypothetical protein